jgi:BirA family biotin operon repressor/biotin-[acetyl-CoA-carboxylase] ligase
LTRWTVHVYKRLESTQKKAESLANAGAPHGTVVASKSQWGGRGRFSRRWVSPPGGLYMSVLLRPRRRKSLELFTLVGALALVLAVEDVAKVGAELRWPNDVMVGGKKLGGVMALASYEGQDPEYLVLGMGLNCNASEEDLGAGRRDRVALIDLVGRKFELESMMLGVLRRLENLSELWESGADDEIIARVRKHMGTLGRRVVFALKDGRKGSGVAVGIGAEGFLILEGPKAVLRQDQLLRLREV